MSTYTVTVTRNGNTLAHVQGAHILDTFPHGSWVARDPSADEYPIVLCCDPSRGYTLPDGTRVNAEIELESPAR